LSIVWRADPVGAARFLFGEMVACQMHVVLDAVDAEE
jgi:hypothetical protein